MEVRTITQVAEEVGVSSDTLRYYEKAGLVTPAGRTPAGYRLYGDDIVNRLRLIRGAQRSGLRLGAVRQLLEIKDRGGCPCGHTQQLVAERIAKLDAEIRSMRNLRVQLADLLSVAASCDNRNVWACEAELINRGGEI